MLPDNKLRVLLEQDGDSMRLSLLSQGSDPFVMTASSGRRRIGEQLKLTGLDVGQALHDDRLGTSLSDCGFEVGIAQGRLSAWRDVGSFEALEEVLQAVGQATSSSHVVQEYLDDHRRLWRERINTMRCYGSLFEPETQVA